MLSLTLLFTSLLAGFAVAQSPTSSSSSSNSSSIDPSSIDLTQRNQACQSELNNCPTLCGGPANLKPGGNTCVGASILSYQCVCANGSAPANIADYQGTVPNFICEQTFASCRKTNPGSQACKTCGTLMPSDVKAIAASTAAPSSSSTSSVSATAASPTATKKSSAGRMEGAVGGVAAGVIAAVLL